MRECKSSKGPESCEDQGVSCLSCDHYVDGSKGIIVDNPPSIHNDRGPAVLTARCMLEQQRIDGSILTLKGL